MYHVSPRLCSMDRSRRLSWLVSRSQRRSKLGDTCVGRSRAWRRDCRLKEIGITWYTFASKVSQNTRRSGHCVGTHPYMKDEFYWVCGKNHPLEASLCTAKFTRGGTSRKRTRHMGSSMPVDGNDLANMGGRSRHISV
jgi:hypothetical protein